AERTRIGECGVDAAAEFVVAARQRRDAALAGRPVARWRIEERLRQTVFVEARLELGSGEVVREQVLDRFEAVTRGSSEAIEERVLVVHHRQIGGETWHDRNSGLRFEKRAEASLCPNAGRKYAPALIASTARCCASAIDELRRGEPYRDGTEDEHACKPIHAGGGTVRCIPQVTDQVRAH